MTVETETKTILTIIDSDDPSANANANANDNANAADGISNVPSPSPPCPPTCSYKGEVLKGTIIKHGHGTLDTSNPFQIKYVGSWQNGLRHGQGVQTWSSGSTYSGNWVNDKRHGMGTYAYADGNTYNGEWVEGLKHGFGTFVWSNSGSKYIGQWGGDVRHGRGVFLYANGRQYDGGWGNNKKHGRGIVTDEGGSTYVGYYMNGKKVSREEYEKYYHAEEQDEEEHHQQQQKQKQKQEQERIQSIVNSENIVDDDKDSKSKGCSGGEDVQSQIKQDDVQDDESGATNTTFADIIRKAKARARAEARAVVETDTRMIQQNTQKNIKDSDNKHKRSGIDVETKQKDDHISSSVDDKIPLYKEENVKKENFDSNSKSGGSINSEREDEATAANTTATHETEIITIQDTPNSDAPTTFSYRGEVKTGTTIKHGFGALNTSNPFKIKYVGEWQNGLKHGQGIQTWSSGSTYRGGWGNDKRHGRGIYSYADGNIYEGEWVEGLKHGRGTFVWSSGSKYKGQWVHDVRHGQGVLTYADGCKYEGGWENNKKHGKGIVTNKDGSTHISHFMKGKKVFQQQQQQQQSTITQVADGEEKKDIAQNVKLGPGRKTPKSKTSKKTPLEHIVHVEGNEKLLSDKPSENKNPHQPAMDKKFVDDKKSLTFEDEVLGDEEDQVLLPPRFGFGENNQPTRNSTTEKWKLLIEEASSNIYHESDKKEKLKKKPSVASEIASEYADTTDNGSVVETGKKFDVFLTHNWGEDRQNRDNHKRVVAFNKELKRNGIKNTWLDEEKLTGNVEEQMSQGIDNSRFVIVFVTKKYIKKTSGSSRMKDNCRLEFNYITQKKSIDEILVVVMEEACSDTTTWNGPVGLHLGGQLYYSCKQDSELKPCAKEVAKELKKRMTPLNLRESLAVHEERKRLLGTRSPHLPGYSCCEDWIQWQRNNHPVFSLCCHHRENPISILKRIVVLIGSLSFGISISNIVFFLVYIIRNDALNDGDFKYYVEYMLTICTLGALIHSLVDLTMLRLTTSLLCGTFAWCFSICLSFLFVCFAVLTTIQVTAPLMGVMDLIDKWLNDEALQMKHILPAYFAELASVYLVFFPFTCTMIFIGAFRPCFRLKLERDRALEQHGGSERIFNYSSEGLPITFR